MSERGKMLTRALCRTVVYWAGVSPMVAYDAPLRGKGQAPASSADLRPPYRSHDEVLRRYARSRRRRFPPPEDRIRWYHITSLALCALHPLTKSRRIRWRSVEASG